MKKLFAISIAIIFASVSFGQKIDESQVPDVVVKTFKARFTTASSAKWEKEDSTYSVEFLMEDANTEADFTAKGEWLNTEWEIPAEYAPQDIKDYITKNYSGYKIKEMSVTEYPVDGKLYVVEINKKKDCQALYFTLKNEFKKAVKLCCVKGKCEAPKTFTPPDTK